MGDLNEVLHPSERRGAMQMTSSMRELQDLVQDLQLMDLDINQKYIWLRKNSASRIDRIMIEKDFFENFQHIQVTCKERQLSDHYSLVMSTSHIAWGYVPFRALDC